MSHLRRVRINWAVFNESSKRDPKLPRYYAASASDKPFSSLPQSRFLSFFSLS